MRSYLGRMVLVSVLGLAASMAGGCGGDDDDDGAAGTSGQGGTAGTAGKGGSAGATAGSAGTTAGKSGSAGTTGGAAGTTGGAAGKSGAAGTTGGSAGTTGGAAGTTGGAAGQGGAGAAGEAGSSGSSGQTAGGANQGGTSAGTAGAAGAAGGAGAAGTTAGAAGAGGAGAAGAGAGGAGAAGAGAGASGASGTGGSAGGTSCDSAPTFFPPNVPTSLDAPAGQRVVSVVYAAGTQDYTCKNTGTDSMPTFTWALVGPDAKLYSAAGTMVGTHSTGPVWTSTDGSSVAGVADVKVSSPRPDAVPWLRLKGTPTAAAGVFSKVATVQRVDTAGGVAPVTGCDSTKAGATSNIPYTATYYFYAPSDASPVCAPPGGVYPPTVNPTLNASADEHAVAEYLAAGTQNYTCKNTGTENAPVYGWALVGPDAKLYDLNGTMVGTHSTGPVWTSTDGSSVAGVADVKVSSPRPDAVPWLHLKGTSTAAAGIFKDVTTVQRVETQAGVAPATGCDSTKVNATTSVAYTATYFFYKK